MTNLSPSDVAGCIDHTLLAPEATVEQIEALCDEAVQHTFAGVCVNPVHVRRGVDRLQGSVSRRSRPAVVSVAGFPLGAGTSAIKADEARGAIDDGATEVDMVVNLGALIGGDAIAVRRDIEAVAYAVHGAGPGLILKVILETGALTEEQIILGCRCAMEGEADFVKTSTGFHCSGGATVEHVRLLKRYGSPLGVKASGGIRTASHAIAMIEAGATRIGTSAGVAIVRELDRSAR